MQLDDNGLEILDRDECFRLLHKSALGRIAFTARALPTVVPVRFRLDGERVLVRIGSDTKLAAAIHDSVVVFEVDDLDAERGSGWSVAATGRATIEHDGAGDDLPPVTPWQPLGAGALLSISTDLVDGRRTRFGAGTGAPS